MPTLYNVKNKSPLSEGKKYYLFRPQGIFFHLLKLQLWTNKVIYAFVLQLVLQQKPNAIVFLQEEEVAFPFHNWPLGFLIKLLTVRILSLLFIRVSQQELIYYFGSRFRCRVHLSFYIEAISFFLHSQLDVPSFTCHNDTSVFALNQ